MESTNVEARVTWEQGYQILNHEFTGYERIVRSRSFDPLCNIKKQQSHPTAGGFVVFFVWQRNTFSRQRLPISFAFISFCFGDKQLPVFLTFDYNLSHPFFPACVAYTLLIA
jgi:hypothetical protein